MAKTAHDYSSKDRTSDVLNEGNVNVDFASLLLSPEVLKGLSQAGFERPSPIQLKAVPLGRCGLDLIVQAKSGTGKTCVFSIVILEGLDLQCAKVQALVLTPTREIATQVQEVIQSIGSAMNGLRCHTFIGGTVFGPDRQNLKKCHVAVGTPGRIKQLIEYGVLQTNSIRLFVLDEADKLLEDNFQDQINWIYNHLPVNKQMLALSATYPEALARGLTTYMRDPTFVRLNSRQVALKGIKQFCKVVPGHVWYHKAFEIKVNHLLELLSQVSFNQCLVFSNLSSRAQNISDMLCEQGWPSTCISGKQDQTQRHSAMSMLKTFKCRVLISTDLTARGIDAENVNLIVNLDVPKDGKTYLHRIGRAGRFGSKGVAVTLANEGNEEMLLRNIQKQCHVKLRNLPDPVPSDLVNISYEAEDISDTDENLSSEHESDNVDNDEEIKPEQSGPQMKTETSFNEEASRENDSPCLQESHSDKGHRRGQKSNHRSGVTRDHSISHVGVADKASQADSLNMPFGMNFPIGLKIPSLAEKLRSKKEEAWSWDTVLADFETSMGSETAKNLPLVKTQASVNEADDCVKFSQNEDLVGDSVGKNSPKSDPRNNTEDLSSDSVEKHSSKSDPRNNTDSIHTTEEADTGLSFSAAKMPENESSERKLGSNPCSQSTVSYNESTLGDSCSQIVEENEKPSESNKEESENSSDITSERTLITDDGDSGTPVSEQNGELVEKNGIEENDTNLQSAQELNTKTEETLKVGFFWRPSADFFDNLVVDGVTESAITDSDDRDDRESDDQTPKPLNENNDPRNGKQIETNEALASPRGVHKIDEYSPNELEVKNDSGRTSESVRPRNRHQIKKIESRSSKVEKSVVKHKKIPFLAESGKLQPDLKNKSASKMEVSKKKFQTEISQGSFKNGDCDSKECIAPSMNEDLSETGALVFPRQTSKDVFLPGEDPIWESYASYLPSKKHKVSDTSSTEQSDISDSDDSDISDSDQSSSDSEQDITSKTRRTSKVSSKNCFSDETNKPTCNYQNWYPDNHGAPCFNYQDLYSWPPSTYQLDPTYACFYGPSGQYTAQYGQDCSSQQDPNYYNYMYGGAYAYSPYTYY